LLFSHFVSLSLSFFTIFSRKKEKYNKKKCVEGRTFCQSCYRCCWFVSSVRSFFSFFHQDESAILLFLFFSLSFPIFRTIAQYIAPLKLYQFHNIVVLSRLYDIYEFLLNKVGCFSLATKKENIQIVSARENKKFFDSF
jgi:hypothetical protein